MMRKFESFAALVLAVFACSSQAVEPKISIGDSHVLLLKSDGTVWAWGSNGNDQLGTGGSSTGTPTQVPGLTGVVDVAAKPNSFSMALKADGTVWVWGNVSSGLSGVSGLSGGVFKNAPFKVPDAQRMVSIAATFGGYTAFAVDADGKVWTWGRGTYGELGDGLTTSSRAEPQSVSGLADVVRVAASNTQILALRADGSVVGWGYNGNGSTEDAMRAGKTGANIIAPSVLNVPALAGMDAASSNNNGLYLGIDAQGHPLMWGDTNSGLIVCHQLSGSATSSISQPYTPTGLDNITQIAGGSFYALFLNAAGQVLGCGYNGNGELGDGTSTSTSASSSPAKPGPVTTQGLPASVVSIAAGTYSSAAIDGAGGVYTWGRASTRLSGQGDGPLPASNTSAVKLSFDAGSTADAPPTYAGTQSGSLASATVDVGVAVAPAHVGQQGQIYVAAQLPNGMLFLLDENGAFVAYDSAKPIPPFFSGKLPKRKPLNLARNSDLQSVSGTVLLMGYGLGSGAAADTDMLGNSRFSSLLQLQ